LGWLWTVNPPDLCFLSNCNYRHKPLVPGSFYFIFWDRVSLCYPAWL
jgi:hypothetical protein